MTRRVSTTKYFDTKTLTACIEKASELAAFLENTSSSKDPTLAELKKTIQQNRLLSRITQQISSLLRLQTRRATPEINMHYINIFNANLISILKPLKLFSVNNKQLALIAANALYAAANLTLAGKTAAGKETHEAKIAVGEAAAKVAKLTESADAEIKAATSATLRLKAAKLSADEAAAKSAILKQEEAERLLFLGFMHRHMQTRLLHQHLVDEKIDFVVDSEDAAALSTQKAVAVIDVTGKTYFDDFAREEEKNKILGNENIRNPKFNRKRISSTLNENVFCFKNHKTPTAAAAESPSAPQIVRRTIQSADKKSRAVEWRVEGKSDLTLEQQFEELAQQSLSFKVAEQLVLQDEINILEKVISAKQRTTSGLETAAASAEPSINEAPANYTVPENPEQRLAELKALQKATKPLERVAHISVPNQDTTKRTTRELNGQKFSATESEFLAVKAHVKFYDVVVFNNITFEKSPAVDDILESSVELRP